MKKNRTMGELSYGISTPSDVLSKLKTDGSKLTESPHPHDIFNFILTAAVLGEWIQRYYLSHSAPKPFSAPSKTRKSWTLPDISASWIIDSSCIPNRERNFCEDIINALSICAHTANASKHFHWQDGGDISEISNAPSITDYYQYFFTSTEPDLYIEFQGQHYGLRQLRGILIQFYEGLISYLESTGTENSPDSE